MVKTTNTNTQQRRTTVDCGESLARSFCCRKTHRSLRTANDEAKTTVRAAASTLNLYSYRRSHIRPLRIHFARSRRGGLRNYVKQNLTHFACSCAYRVALLILKGINLTAFIKRKNRWLCGHSYTPSLDRTSALALIEGNAYHMVTGTTRLMANAFTAAGQTRL